MTERTLQVTEELSQAAGKLSEQKAAQALLGDIHGQRDSLSSNNSGDSSDAYLKKYNFGSNVFEYNKDGLGHNQAVPVMAMLGITAHLQFQELIPSFAKPGPLGAARAAGALMAGSGMIAGYYDAQHLSNAGDLLNTTKYGVSLAADAGMVAGGALTALRAGPIWLGPILFAGSTAARIGADWIPNKIEKR